MISLDGRERQAGAMVGWAERAHQGKPLRSLAGGVRASPPGRLFRTSRRQAARAYRVSCRTLGWVPPRAVSAQSRAAGAVLRQQAGNLQEVPMKLPRDRLARSALVVFLARRELKASVENLKALLESGT